MYLISLPHSLPFSLVCSLQVNITGVVVDPASRRVWTADAAGAMMTWNLTDGSSAQYVGAGHPSVVDLQMSTVRKKTRPPSARNFVFMVAFTAIRRRWPSERG